MWELRKSHKSGICYAVKKFNVIELQLLHFMNFPCDVAGSNLLFVSNAMGKKCYANAMTFWI